MASDQIANYLLALRKRSGFSQGELAEMLGIVSEYQVSRHERSLSTPSLLGALGYAAMFRRSVAEIFPGFYRTISTGIEERLRQMEQQLQASTAKGRDADPIARKLEFMWERRNPDAANGVQTP
jgi:transcriptional regulator with XRE-family HTH domain